MFRKPSLETWTYVYIVLFFLLIGLNFFPFLYQEDGRMIGGFNLAEEGNILHVLSGIWAATALWYSRNSMLYYFRIFGTVYLLDGAVGLIVGKAFLNLNLFRSDVIPHEDFMVRLLLNTPHLLIGGVAVIIGFMLFRKYAN